MNKNRIGFRQTDIFKEELQDFDMPNRGCGPTSLATALVNLGIEINPLDVFKKIIVDGKGNFDNTYLAKKGSKTRRLDICIRAISKRRWRENRLENC